MSLWLTISCIIAVTDMNTVVIIGGGASGMMAALSASEDKNNMVIHTIEYNKQLDNCYGRLDTDSEKGICGILDILCKIEAYLENGKK